MGKENEEEINEEENEEEEEENNKKSFLCGVYFVEVESFVEQPDMHGLGNRHA